MRSQIKARTALSECDVISTSHSETEIHEGEIMSEERAETQRNSLMSVPPRCCENVFHAVFI